MSVSGPSLGADPIALAPPNRAQAAGGPNRNSVGTHSSPDSSLANSSGSNETQWGSNFWVTLVDPLTNTSFYACPSSGQVSWDPPVGNFVLPPSAEGEWWELSDDSRGGIPYYYHTKTGNTVWERPEGFVIPLGILQNTAVGRRISLNMFGANGSMAPSPIRPQLSPDTSNNISRAQHTRSNSTHSQRSTSSHGSSNGGAPHSGPTRPSPAIRRATVDQPRGASPAWAHGQPLSPIPGSPDVTDADTDVDRASQAPAREALPRERGMQRAPSRASLKVKAKGKEKERASRVPDELGRIDAHDGGNGTGTSGSTGRGRSKSQSYLPRAAPQQVQSLNAAASLVVQGPSASTRQSLSAARSAAPAFTSTPVRPKRGRSNTDVFTAAQRDASREQEGAKGKGKKTPPPPSPRRPIPAVPGGLAGSWSKRNGSTAAISISSPVLDLEATANMTPVKNRAMGKPIHINQNLPSSSLSLDARSSMRILPDDLVSDIQQFIASDFAKQYFSTHRTGFLFKRKIPVAQMMAWQKSPLSSPLLVINRTLQKDAVKIFKVIQRIMGDRPGPLRNHSTAHVATIASDDSGGGSASSAGLLEEERWLLGEGLMHGELRDEIYCQLMKQLSGNPNPESIFKGWQFLCVLLITFPPSKNFEAYLRTFIHQRTSQSEGRVDVMAKYCLRRLVHISKKGPRGKAPTPLEIETASDAAFNPSIFGESLGAIIRLQERQYPDTKIPIILPFLADGILALGGAKAEGIFRVPGDGDDISELKLRIERGYYTLDGLEDAHALASLLKLWLRELLDPLVPDELYNECVGSAHDASACIALVGRLPTINRRVVLFVVSFLQLFLDPKIQKVTKMTPVNLALVMAPNLLRCNSDSMAVVFTNTQYEQQFVYNLLLHLHCDEVDPEYRPSHGLGAKPRASMSSRHR